MDATTTDVNDVNVELAGAISEWPKGELESGRRTGLLGWKLPHLETNIYGDDGKQTLFFIHGWPDDQTLWNSMVDRYTKKGFRCVCVTMPHYSSLLGRCWLPML